MVREYCGLAINGGTPVRDTLLPYGHQFIHPDDIKEVIAVLESDWLTTGPKVLEFEQEFAKMMQVNKAVAVSSGTAALHAAMYALRITPGAEVIVPTMTFTATANCVVYLGGTPVFADVEPDTLCIDVEKAEKLISEKTEAIIAVDYAGQPCDYTALSNLSAQYNIPIVADACHSLGGSYKNKSVGSLADLNVFSFHPVKNITTGEGGMITTDYEMFENRMRVFRNHGITADHSKRLLQGTWFYEINNIGFNYRLTDIQSALGISQLKHLPVWIKRRQALAKKYDTAFRNNSLITPLTVRDDVSHAYHLYVVKVNLTADRRFVFNALRAEGIGVNVHYIPVHLHPYYRREFKTYEGQCPVAESAYEQIISLPIFPSMYDSDADDVIAAVNKMADAL